MQDAELLPLVNNTFHQPFTMLWPTDEALSSLPGNMQKWLFHREHRDKLAAFLKGHMIRDTQVNRATKCLLISFLVRFGMVSPSKAFLPDGNVAVGAGERDSVCNSKLKLFIYTLLFLIKYRVLKLAY